MKLPKYVRAAGNSLFYQRDFPTSLQQAAGKKTFTYPLKIKTSEIRESALLKAVQTASEVYQLQVKMITRTESSAYNLRELDLAATAFLNARRLRAAQYATDTRDPNVISYEQANQINTDEDNFSLAEYALPEFEEVRFKQGVGEPLTFQDQVIGHAWLKLVDAAKSKPQTLSQLWDEYAAEKGKDASSKEGKREHVHWKNWLAATGEIATSAEGALDHIHNGLDRFVAEQLGKGLKGQSVNRALAQVLACLRRGSKKYRFGWVIEPPFIPNVEPKGKAVLTQSEQRDLISYCLNSQQGKMHRKVAVTILVMLQGGCMTSEVGRLLSEDLGTAATVPHLLIKNRTKQTARKRVIPVVIGADYIHAHVRDGVEWIKSRSDTSTTIKRFLKRATGNRELTGHCLRHTIRANALANGASDSAVAAISGWKGLGSVSTIMLGYGEEGLSNSVGLKALQRESLIIHKHLLT